MNQYPFKKIIAATAVCLIVFLAAGFCFKVHADNGPCLSPNPLDCIPGTTQNAIYNANNNLTGGLTTVGLTGTPIPPSSTYTPFSGFGSALLNRFQGLGNSSSLSDFLNALFALIVSIGSVLAVVMIMYEGYSYFASTRDGRVVAAAETKQKIIKIVLGFLLLLCIYTILRTINPDLLNLNVNISGLTIAGQDGIDLVTNLTGGSPASQSANNNPSWVQQNGAAVQMKLPNGGTVSIRPCDSNTLTRITLFEQPFTVSKTEVASLARINAKWLQLGGNSFYRIPETSADASAEGSYNCELVPGTNSPAAHAYGLAIDINPAENTYGSTLVTDMPPAFIQLFTDEGWGWGGNWHNKKDAMHFSKFINEQGNMVASDNI